MKKFIYGISFLALVGIIIVGCQKEGIHPTNTNSVITKHSENMVDNVDSILIVTKKHPLFIEAVSSDEFKTSNITSINNTIGIYYYSNGYTAILISDIKDETIFSYIISSSTNKKVQSLNANFNYDKNGKPKLTMDFSMTPLNFNSSSRAKTWGNCMSDAIDQLYNDWSNDAVGTFTCWITGPLCVVGGGIACAIQTW